MSVCAAEPEGGFAQLFLSGHIQTGDGHKATKRLGWLLRARPVCVLAPPPVSDHATNQHGNGLAGVRARTSTAD